MIYEELNCKKRGRKNRKKYKGDKNNIISYYISPSLFISLTYLIIWSILLYEVISPSLLVIINAL